MKQQREELARELVRKDSQVKEMQQRLESGEGCKLLSSLGFDSGSFSIEKILLFSMYIFSSPFHPPFLLGHFKKPHLAFILNTQKRDPLEIFLI